MFARSIASRLKVGESISVTVKEILEDAYLIVSLEGHLLRIHNETGEDFEPEDQIRLRVRTVQPLSFRWAKREGAPQPGSYNQVI